MKKLFCFVLLDLDLFKSTIAALNYFYPKMIRGGYIFIHDYNNPESNYAISRALREFMFDNVYMPINGNAESTLAREIMEMLHGYLTENPDQIPDIYFLHEESVGQAVIDYLSGMTDYYAIRLAESIKPGISKGLSFRIVPD